MVFLYQFLGGDRLAQYDGSIRVNTKIDQSGFYSGVRSMESGITRLGGSLMKLASVVGIAFGVAKIIQFGKEAVDLASDLNEVQNVVETAFGGMSNQVDAWAKNSIKQFGMSELAAKQMASTYMAMNAGMGLNGQGAADMAMKTAERAADVASFYNKSIEESDTMLKSIWTGETESLKQIGVVMTQTNLDAYALANGYGKTVQEMTQAEQVQLRYAYVMEQTRLAAGDFVKTQDSWANQTRILSEQWKQFLSIIGSSLIQVLTPALKFLNQFLGVMIQWAQTFSAIISGLFGTQASAAQSAAAVTGAAASSASSLASSTADAASEQKKLASSTKKTNEQLNGQVASFDKLNVLQSSQDTGATSGGSNTGAPAGGGVSVPVLSGEIGTGVTVSKDLQNTIDTIKEFFASVQQAFVPTQKALSGLWVELQRLGGFAWDGLKDFYNSFLKPIGIWTLGEGIPRFVDALTNGLAAVNWGNINSSLHGLWVALEPFAVNVGEGLLWFWENVLVPLGTWTMNEVVPRFIEILSGAIDTANAVLETFKPFGQWLYDNFLLPIANWTGGVIVSILENLSNALEDISNWIEDNQSTVQGMTITVLAFFAAWKITELLSFIQQSGGIISALQRITSAVSAGTLAKIKDKAETIALNLLYAKDFVVNLAKGTAALAKQVTQWALETAAKAASTVATWAHQAATVAATAATWLFNAAMTVLTSPITLVVLAIAALVAIIIICIKYWDNIAAAAQACWDAICAAFQAAGDWFYNNVIKPVVDFFVGLWNNITGAASTAWNYIKAIWNVVASWFNVKIIQPIKDFFTGMWNGVKNAASTAWNGIKGTWNAVASWFDNTIIKPLQNFFAGMWSGLTSGASAAWNGIKSVFSSVANWFKDIFSKAWEAVKNVFSTGGKIFDGIKDGIVNAFKAVVNAIITGLNKVISIPFNTINGILNGIRSINILGMAPFSGLWRQNPLSVPQIPYLAQGAVIPPNHQFMAVLGDQKNGNNLELPESLLRKAIREEGRGAQNITIAFTGNLGAFARVLKPELDKASRRAGVNLVVTGGI